MRCGGARVRAQLAVEQQRQPAAHAGADEDARPSAFRVNMWQDCSSQCRDGAVDEQPARRAMAGIVEAEAGAPGFPRQCGQRLGLGALHVGFEAAQPEEAAAADILAPVLAIG